MIPAQDGPFPTLDGIHNFFKGRGGRFGGPRRTASEERTGSGEDWSAFLDKTGIEQTVIFPTKGLAVGFIQTPEYATRLCRAYNDYVYHRYRRVDARIHPLALVPMQSPGEAALELRRVVKDLGLRGAMLPTTGLPLHLAHEYYHPVYREAADLGCVLALHGGSNRGIGIDDFTDFIGSHILHHPVPLMYGLVSFVYHGVLDRFPGLKLAFLEGGPGWLVPVLDRAIRDDESSSARWRSGRSMRTSRAATCSSDARETTRAWATWPPASGSSRSPYSSDYPHEVDLAGAMHEIEETLGERCAERRAEARRALREHETLLRAMIAIESGAWAALALGFLLGLKHATDADHVVAVTTVVAEHANAWRSVWVGVSWGLGHTTPLLVLGGIVLGAQGGGARPLRGGRARLGVRRRRHAGIPRGAGVLQPAAGQTARAQPPARWTGARAHPREPSERGGTGA